jgi:cyclase
MFEKRVIPVLTVVNEDLVKTRQFQNPSYLGDPLNIIRIFNEKEVDELILLDIGKARSAPINFELLSSLSEECNMPLTYGGKISNFEDAQRILQLGFEKILVRGALENNPDLISQVASNYGSQSVVCAFDVRTDTRAVSEVVEEIALKVVTAQELGGGEIFINDIDRDGTLQGANQNVIKGLCGMSKVPMVWGGGFNSQRDIEQGLESGLSGVAIGAYFSYFGKYRSVLITYPGRNRVIL